MGAHEPHALTSTARPPRPGSTSSSTSTGPAPASAAPASASSITCSTCSRRHGRLDLVVDVTGDLETGAHHTVEDIGIALGQALDEALGDRVRDHAATAMPSCRWTRRARVCAIDISGRPLLVFDADLPPGASPAAWTTSWSRSSSARSPAPRS